MLYETLKWPQIAPFCISSKQNSRPPPPLTNYGVHTNKPQLRPCWLTVNQRNTQCQNIAELTSANVEEWRRFPQERPRILVRGIDGAIWGHFKVSYNIESSTILMTLIDKNFLKLSKICPSCLSRYEHLHCCGNDLPATLCTTLDSVNPVLYPSIDTILIKLWDVWKPMLGRPWRMTGYLPLEWCIVVAVHGSGFPI
jgi:hypothetical protein